MLYNFCSQPRCADGKTPRASLVADESGSLYGTTWLGGASDCGCGTVFELRRRAQKYMEQTVWAFNGPGKGEDGYWPSSGLIRDRRGVLYGTTEQGGYPITCLGRNAGCGTVYELRPFKGKYIEKILWRFNIEDGALPSCGLTEHQGKLYGTTLAGGSYVCISQQDCGTPFELSRSGNGYTQSVLWNFKNQQDGFFPDAAPVFDTSGTLYGTTNFGGAYSCEIVQGCGTVFKLTP